MRARTAFLLALLLSLLTAAVAIAADPPAVTTHAATAVSQSKATLHASVDPKGTATKVRWEVGTTTTYGLNSAEVDAGSGAGAKDVSVDVDGLAAGTTYHFRAVATSAAGTAQGTDLTFKTAGTPQRPGVGSLAAIDVSDGGATLRGRIDPKGQSTTYRFEYWISSSARQHTDAFDAGAGTGGREFRAHVLGLEPGKRYYFCLVATNPTGTTRGATRSFTTAAYPSSATLQPARSVIPFGQDAGFVGQLAGPRTSGVRVALEVQPFPFSAPFASLASATSDRSGLYRFTLRGLQQTTKVRVLAPGGATSQVHTLHSAVRLGLERPRRFAGRLTFAGRVVPATAQGRASLQRQVGDRFVTVRRANLAPDGTFSISVKARRDRATYRVVASPNDGGAHVRSASAWKHVAGSARARR